MAQDLPSEHRDEQDFQLRMGGALAVVEREGIDGEIKLAREANKWTCRLRDLSRMKCRLPLPPSIEIANLPAELGHFRSLTRDDEEELRSALSILIDELRAAMADNFRYAGSNRPSEVIDLSQAQMRAILIGEHLGQGSTLDALERKRMISYESGRRVMTDDARAYAWAVYDRSTKRMMEREFPKNAPLIQSTYDLLDLMFPRAQVDPEISIYVYRGNTPMVVRNGDGQNPLAYLHRYFMWQIEVDKTVGDFLEKYAIISHKGSYGYLMKPQKD